MKIFTTHSAGLVYLLREYSGRTQVLLQLRGGNKYGAGEWDASSAGHVDEDESMIACAIREAREEIGIDIKPADIVFTTIIHKGSGGQPPPDGRPYYNGHFFVEKFRGEPRNCESNKITGLKWFYIDELPENMFADRGDAIQNFIKKINYSEVGWD